MSTRTSILADPGGKQEEIAEGMYGVARTNINNGFIIRHGDPGRRGQYNRHGQEAGKAYAHETVSS